ncbi:glycoside hydrolase family 3 N-terminal domain-containing protein [Streptomyces sp. NPDC048659]|uniref:glycoside hydrolase family 3 protein n=1 Tax=Streptomyces sp. NPDC048659 TaxID=3155489 RepID=UPI003421FB29
MQFTVRNKGHPYQDPELPTERRVEDLISRMTVAEKAGQLFHTMLAMHPDGGTVEKGDPGMVPLSTTDMLQGQHMTHFNLLGTYEPAAMARWQNTVQAMAADTRLGIPVTLSTDPRHAFTDNAGASFNAGAFSAWPEPLGLAATRDPQLVLDFADTVRREYLAVGFRVALHPQIDLATEPRWSRQSGTFGSDAALTSQLVRAYVQGLQGAELGRTSVAAMVKHFPGGGPQKDGEDPHFPHGKEQVYPGGLREYHLEPFKAAIAAGCAQMMPYYGQPVGTDWEEVGFGFNKGVIQGLLRERLGFDGIVCTDWGLISDSEIFGEHHDARAWGLEHLTESERVARVLDAGCDQFGGEARSELVVELVESGRIQERRLDESLRRVLTQKFALGLFDTPYVDEDRAAETVGRADFAAAGAKAQRRSLTLLKNTPGTLPLTGRPTLYVENVSEEVARAYAELAADPADAEVAVLRLRTPYEVRDNKFESFFHSGTLAFSEAELEPILHLLDTVPTVVCVNLERAAVIPEIAERAAALVADFGASDAALLDVVFGRARPEGRLPFELPRSMAAVAASCPDVPNDTENPVFPYGAGLSLYPPPRPGGRTPTGRSARPAAAPPRSAFSVIPAERSCRTGDDALPWRAVRPGPGRNGVIEAHGGRDTMGVRARLRGGAVSVGAAVLAVGTLGAGVAPAQAVAADQWRPQPGTLYISDLPRTESWRANPTARGWGNDFDCAVGWPAEPAEVNVWHRDFTTAETALAQQKVAVFATEAEAIAFADKARQDYIACAQAPQRPGVTATYRDHGVINVEEGATLQGMHTFDANATERPDYNYLWGVGRDGDTVTLVLWQSYWGDPPVIPWKNTLNTAVKKLY